MTTTNIPKRLSMDFSDTSIKLTRSLSKTVKKEEGIFFTPPYIVDKLIQKTIEKCPDILRTPIRILEPSAGSGECIRGIQRSNIRGSTIDAIELNHTIYTTMVSVSDETLIYPNTVQWIHSDFIQYRPEANTMYDFILGNPPYFVMDTANIPPTYSKYITGRPNIFGLFILHSLSILALNGILAFVVPRSFLNSAYYGMIRTHLKQVGQLMEIVDFSDDAGFMDTQQNTIGMIFRKTGCETIDCDYSIWLGDHFAFSDNANQLRDILRGSTTLSRLGLSVKTGNIVWNQKKELLTNDPSQTLLIYNSNISDDHTIDLMEFKNDAKKQFIQMDGIRDTVIVVNRGNGNSAYKHSYAIVQGGLVPFLVENHLNVIYAPGNISVVAKQQLFNIVMRSFQNIKTEQFIRLFLGNGGLSKTELENVFPIFT